MDNPNQSPRNEYVPISEERRLFLEEKYKRRNLAPESLIIRPGFRKLHLATIVIGLASIAVVSISILGLTGVIKGSRRLMNLYFGLVLAFIGVQVGYAVAGFISETSWVEASLERSWGDAYQKDPSLIYDLQTEVSAIKFGYIKHEYQILETMYGSQLDRIGSMVVCVRLIQLGSVLLLSILFKYLAVLDSKSSSIESGSVTTESSLSDGKLPFFVSEKQLEDQDARIPLLFQESEHPDYFNEAHFAESDAHRQGYQPLEDKVDKCCSIV
ncbi:hypothetical protein BG000_000233 [Podila horticola]|nr:hypothetical protein BG000_000233 [Podila horticola]